MIRPTSLRARRGTTLIRRPSWSNLTVPSISEKIVQSRPTPTFLPGVPLRPVLAAEDAAGLGDLAAEELDPQHLRIRVAAVAARALSFFVSHESSIPLRCDSQRPAIGLSIDIREAESTRDRPPRCHSVRAFRIAE